jgi:uncharacterized membrane-anchored protein YitT (DUF2179 family)
MFLQVKGFKLIKENIIVTFIRYLILLLGSAILAFGLYNVHSQSNITEGGILGLTLWIEHWFNISPSVSGFLINILCYMVGLRFMGKEFICYSLAANCGFTYFYSLSEKIGHVLPSFADRPFIAALLGGCFVGLGVGLIVRIGGASAGDDAIALAVNRSFKIPLTGIYFIMDFVVLTLSLSYIPTNKIGWSFITVLISSIIIGLVQYIKS